MLRGPRDSGPRPGCLAGPLSSAPPDRQYQLLQGVLSAAQVVLTGSQGGEPVGWIIIWGTCPNKIKIRIQADFIEGYSAY